MTRRTPRLGAWVLTKMVEYLQRVPFYALRDVSLEVRRGQILGVIGPNGSGKSTLLKVLAGITPPTRGTVKLRGRVASLLEVGVGFHPDLTGMENIFYHAALHGLCHDEVLERLETIIEFSGLRDYLYEPVKHYSSGMYARLGCSVALHLDPEIALIDEILSVGDTEFRERVHSRMRRMIDSGVTVVLVTHEVGTAASFCQELIWLDGGRVRARGRPEEIQRAYERELVRRRLPEDHVMARALLELQQSEGENPENERVEGTAEPAAIAKRDSGGAERKAEILSARFLDAEGQPLQRVRTGETLRLEVEAHARGSLGSTAMRVIVWRSNGEVLGSHLSPAKLLGQGQTGRWRLRWDPVLWLSPAVHFTVALVDPRDPDRAVSAPYPSLGLEVVPPTMPDIHIPHLVPCRWQRTGNGEERRPHEGGL